MSSADSVSRRLTAAPTVPYPSSATCTSTDAMDLRSLFLHVQSAKSRTDLPDLFVRQLGAVLVEDGRAAVHLRDPLAREGAVADGGEDVAHVLAHVLVDDLRADGVRAVLGGVGDR